MKRTLDDFAKLLRTNFDEDDDPKGISSVTNLIWIVCSNFKAKN